MFLQFIHAFHYFLFPFTNVIQYLHFISFLGFFYLLKLNVFFQNQFNLDLDVL